MNMQIFERNVTAQEEETSDYISSIEQIKYYIFGFCIFSYKSSDKYYKSKNQ